MHGFRYPTETTSHRVAVSAPHSTVGARAPVESHDSLVYSAEVKSRVGDTHTQVQTQKEGERVERARAKAVWSSRVEYRQVRRSSMRSSQRETHRHTHAQRAVQQWQGGIAVSHASGARAERDRTHHTPPTPSPVRTIIPHTILQHGPVP